MNYEQLLERFHRSLEERQLPDVFSRPHRGSIEERYSIYVSGFDVRARSSLEEMYPVLADSLPEELWLGLVSEYVDSLEARGPDLNRLGLGLPEFMEAKAFQQPWVELAQLERSCFEVFHAQNLGEISLEALSAMTETSKIDFQESCQLKKFFSSAFDVWSSGSELIAQENPSFILIFRKSFQVQARKMGEAEWKVLEALIEGKSLGEALEGAELSAEELQSILFHWVEAEIIRKIY